VTTPLFDSLQGLKLEDFWNGFEQASGKGIDVYLKDSDDTPIHCVFMASLGKGKIVYDFSKVNISETRKWSFDEMIPSDKSSDEPYQMFGWPETMFVLKFDDTDPDYMWLPLLDTIDQEDNEKWKELNFDSIEGSISWVSVLWQCISSSKHNMIHTSILAYYWL
jgi:hypothetical protein